MAWNPTQEEKDATAEWAVRQIPRGSTGEGRTDFLRLLIINTRLDLTAEELNRWCRKWENPDDKSGLSLKGDPTEIVENASAPDQEEESDSRESSLRAEGFRSFAELLMPANEPLRFHYPPRRAGTQTRFRKKVGVGAEWRTIEGGGSVDLKNGSVVDFVTSCTVGIRNGQITWALPEVGPQRVWYHKQNHVLEYEIRKIETKMSRAVIGTRAMALAATYAPGAVDHKAGAAMAKALGIDDRQLLHYHKRAVQREVEERTARANQSAAIKKPQEAHA